MNINHRNPNGTTTDFGLRRHLNIFMDQRHIRGGPTHIKRQDAIEAS
jgi:hypothetical protein